MTTASNAHVPRAVDTSFVPPAVAPGPFGVYVHVPYCTVRCGYCDFNTYTAGELQASSGGIVSSEATASNYAAQAVFEMRHAVAHSGVGEPAGTVFFGGGTPTLLPAADLVAMLDGVRDTWGLRPGAEVTTEANPDTVSPEYFERLRAGGFTRVSVGMQSAVPHVLATLDRTHTPANVGHAVAAAKAAGLQVSLDLIYGTPGESLADWRTSLDAVVSMEPDHVSAYALVVEPGTRMARQVRSGEISLPDLDDQAEKYELADEVLTGAGLSWYEISNWSRDAASRCHHNISYWNNSQWWGVGPGAHSHIAGARFWNVKHPATYAKALAQSVLPIGGGEHLDAAARNLEEILLHIRLAEGLDLKVVPEQSRAKLAGFVADGSIDGRALLAGRVVLTRRGRLLADAIVRDIA